jgi:fructose-1,6-bisphosphatase/sedoheptulose 1,7-bisphosphatase-like protein
MNSSGIDLDCVTEAVAIEASARIGTGEKEQAERAATGASFLP